MNAMEQHILSFVDSADTLDEAVNKILFYGGQKIVDDFKMEMFVIGLLGHFDTGVSVNDGVLAYENEKVRFTYAPEDDRVTFIHLHDTKHPVLFDTTTEDVKRYSCDGFDFQKAITNVNQLDAIFKDVLLTK